MLAKSLEKRMAWSFEHVLANKSRRFAGVASGYSCMRSAGTLNLFHHSKKPRGCVRIYAQGLANGN
jgi:hypothetical protein